MKRAIMLTLPILMATVAAGILLVNAFSAAETSTGVPGELAAGNSGDAAQTLPRDILFTQPVQSVVFSHQTHALDQGFECGACHEGLFQMKAGSMQSRPDFNMAGLAQGKYCGACHSSGNSTAFATDSQCARCHRGVKEVERVA